MRKQLEPTQRALDFMALVKANPTLLPRAPDGLILGDQINHRLLDQVHVCALGVCGGDFARAVLIAQIDGRNYWVDLCAPCAAVVRYVVAAAELRGRMSRNQH